MPVNVPACEPSTYRALGLAIVVTQTFELSFAFAVRLALRQANAASVEDVQKLDDLNTIKNSAGILLSKLDVQSAYGEEILNRIKDLAERRNRIAHRLALENRWPFDPSLEAAKALREDCDWISLESAELAAVFLEQLSGWMERVKGFEITEDVRLEIGQYREVLRAFRSQVNSET
jgi:hypothetical protein